jgi:HTH-type transcriptional regulator / antitoxin HigA
MSKNIKNQFVPDYAVAPGETLLETLEANGMSQAEFALRTGRPKKTINEIIKGKSAITPETALQFERVLNIPSGFWNNLERNYQETLARINEQKRLQGHLAWLKRLPLKALITGKYVKPYPDKIEQLQAVLNFFGIATPEQLEKSCNLGVSYRKSDAFKSDDCSIAAWLRIGELHARKIVCESYNTAQFKNALEDIRGLTMQLPTIFQKEVVRLCADAGVAVVFVPELPGIRTSGATWWLHSKKAVIQLSLRHKSDDHLWFSFFHEAGHILLHGKKEKFIEDDNKNAKESEADKFASDFLIPTKQYRQFIQQESYSSAAIRRFAGEIGVASGIVVGRLQHEGLIPHSHCNELKLRYHWVT